METVSASEVAAARERLTRCRRLVVKIGSALLADSNPDPFARLAEQVSMLKAQGIDVVVVSSGAIALGLKPLGFVSRPKLLADLQAAASVGQSILMARWQKAFHKNGLQVAQILLTHDDVDDRERYLNAQNAIRKLIEYNVVPVVNENDTVSVREIKFGDNDELAAHIAGLVEADVMALLTQTNGLFSSDPLVNPEARRLPMVKSVSKEVEALASGAANLGTGGMSSKLRAVQHAARHGSTTLILPGREDSVLTRALAGEDLGTHFIAPDRKSGRAKQRWLELAVRAQGRIVVDPGATQAIRKNASLLFVGVKEVHGFFRPGDPVDIISSEGTPVARGLVAVSSADLQRVCGKKQLEAEETLGCPVPQEVVHRDNLVLLEGGYNAQKP
ncbi:MAG: glutamate 5-kinase [Pseudomonadota bacterium]|jgi:glutamate 5-kinase